MRSLSHIVPVILAAGNSRRMGYPKALLPLGEETFISRILETIRKVGLSESVVILGKAAAVIEPAIADWPARIFVNHDPDRGQLSSIQLALSQLGAETEAAMIWPVDQPAVSEDLVRELTRRFVKAESLIVMPKFRDRRGHPALFHHSIFQEFMETPLEEGPKRILVRHAGDILEIATEESGVVQDIDTPSEYEALTGENLNTALSRRKST